MFAERLRESFLQSALYRLKKIGRDDVMLVELNAEREKMIRVILKIKMPE